QAIHQVGRGLEVSAGDLLLGLCQEFLRLVVLVGLPFLVGVGDLRVDLRLLGLADARCAVPLTEVLHGFGGVVVLFLLQGVVVAFDGQTPGPRRLVVRRRFVGLGVLGAKVLDVRFLRPVGVAVPVLLDVDQQLLKLLPIGRLGGGVGLAHDFRRVVLD